MGDRLISVRERLEKLKNQESKPKVIWGTRPKEEEPKRTIISPETMMVNKIEKSINKLEQIERKMANSENYLGMYYEFQKSKKEFLKLIEETKVRNFVFEDFFERRVRDVKRKYNLD